METSSKALNNSKGGWSTCDSAGCEPSQPVPSIRERATLLNRRELGLTIPGASTAVLDGGSQVAPTGQANSNRRKGAGWGSRSPAHRHGPAWFDRCRLNSPMALQPQFLAGFLIAYRGEINSSVEKLVKGAEQLHATPELNRLFE
jgi:hypothetical protein